MDAFYLSSSSSFLPRTRRLCFVVSKHRLCLPLRINNMVYCQGGGSNIVTTGRAVDQASKAAALMEAGSLLLAPNGNAQAAASSASASAAAENVGMKELVSSYVEKHEDGIGIVRFLRGKSFLITGGTGFLGKVLIEKILRTVPDVHKIYILIKADNKEVAMERLKKEIISAELFKFLKQTYGKSYQVFMLSKLVPVVGNVCESDLGIDDHTAEMIAKEVDIIVNSAANTTFDERYDVALDINTGGPNRLMKFAHQCHKLKLFLHVSTAYVNGQRQGKIIEKPFCIGESIAGESVVNGNQESSVPELNVEDEMEMVLSAKQGLSDGAMAQKMKELGLERANKFGWQDTYVFTKAMGEMMIDNMRGNIPVVIVRPSVIESTHKEPFPGWMEGNRMMDPIILHYGKGQLTGFLVDPNGVLDVVPADMVVNATLAAMAKHGAAGKPGTSIYHIASSVVNPLVFDDLARLLYEHFQSKPYIDSKGKPIDVPRMKLFSSMEALSSHLWRDAIDKSGLTALGDSKGKLSAKLENICRKSVEQAKYLASIYEPYTFYGGRFDNSNAQKLMECMSKEERWQFGFEVESIDWKDYISNVHIPGLRRHVMKGRGSCS